MPKERRKTDAGKEANSQKDKLRNTELKKIMREQATRIAQYIEYIYNLFLNLNPQSLGKLKKVKNAFLTYGLVK